MAGEFVDNLHAFGVLSHELQLLLRPCIILQTQLTNMGIESSRAPPTPSFPQPHHSFKTLIRKNSASLHSLHSPSLSRPKQHIWRKWKFCSYQRALDRFQQLQNKMNNPLYSQHFLAIEEVDFAQTNTNQHIYWVSAKVEYPAHTLKSDLLDRKATLRSYSQVELWKILHQILDMIERSASFKSSLPDRLDEILLVPNKNLKVKDPEMLTEIRTNKSDEMKPLCQIGLTIVKHIVSLSLLEEKERVTFHDINKVNLKYGACLSAFIFKIQKQKLGFEQMKKIALLAQTNSMESLLHAHPLKRIDIEAHGNIGNFGAVTLENDENLDANKAHAIANYQIIEQKGVQIQQGQAKNRRIQALKPKSMGQSKATQEGEETLSKEKSKKEYKMVKNQGEEPQMNKEEESVDKNEQKQEKRGNQSLGTETNKTSLKTSLQIEDHHFPKTMKVLKKTSSTFSDQIPESSRANHIRNMELNEEFLRVVQGDRKCQLFNAEGNESLLESIIESQESIVIRTGRESPMVGFDEEIESITRDFMHLQQEFINAEDREQNVSIFDFNPHQRNSTIIELTEQNEDSDQEDASFDGRLLSELSSVHARHRQEEEEEKFTIEQYEGGSKYEGYTVNGLRHGFGKLFYEDGGSYEGNWREGEIDGYGKLYYQSGNLAFEGEWVRGEFHGEGKIFNESPQLINGQFDYRDFSEIGTAWCWYEGSFEHDHKHGKGTLMLSNGERLEGRWNMNNVEGNCIFYSGSGREIEGTWRNNQIDRQSEGSKVRQD